MEESKGELTRRDAQLLARRIAARAYLDSEEEIAGWIIEFASIYERERQIKTLSRPGSKYYVSYDPDYKDKVFGVFNKEDLTQQGAEKMAQQLNNLEAERSELRNKVIELEQTLRKIQDKAIELYGNQIELP